jgi:uncharacterized protein YecE (DUF72 family)
MTEEIFIGTSGYSYKHWSDRFYPKELSQNQWLEYYAKTFSSVELNVTYYRLPTEKMYETWKKNTPDNFVYALKGSRYITHIKRLREIEKALKSFISGTEILNPKARALLWQFSPRFEKNPERLSNFLEQLSKLKYDLAFEFRNKTWFDDEIYNLLRTYNAALVYADSPGFPAVEKQTADFAYLRFHGGTELYGSAYSKQELMDWAKRIEKMNAKRIYIYFNNDAYGYAVENAITLKNLLST